MSNCRPVMDSWVLARPKLVGKRKYYGAYPAGLRSVAMFPTAVGFGNRLRVFGVYEAE